MIWLFVIFPVIIIYVMKRLFLTYFTHKYFLSCDSSCKMHMVVITEVLVLLDAKRTICLRVIVRLEKCYLNLKMAWLLVADRLDWAHTDTHAHTPPYKHLFGLQRMVWKRENIQCAEVMWTKIPWSQRKMGRLVGDEIHLKLQYNQGVQNYISEPRICRILNQMGDSSRWPHWMHVRWKQFKEKVQFQKIQ